MRFFPIGLIFILVLGSTAYAQEDPVMKFYLNKLDSSFQDEYIFVSDAVFDVSVRSIFQETDYRGKAKGTDTAVYRIYYTNEQIDSFTVIDSAGEKDNKLPDRFFFVPPWYQDYDFYFFPNDTGAGALAIGFQPDSTQPDTLTTGMLMVDRDTYKLKSIMLYDPTPENVSRLSEIYEFGPRGKYQILLNYEKHMVNTAFLGKKYTNQKFEFFDYNIK